MWEVIVIPLMVINHVRQRQMRDLCVENFLVPKRLALGAALDTARGDRSRDAARAWIHAETQKTRESADEALYADAVREAQHLEMDWLLDHDLRLLDAEGETYHDLVKAAFDRAGYEQAMAELLVLEKAVSEAALKSLPIAADPEVAARLHAALAEIRTNETERIFGTTP